MSYQKPLKQLIHYEPYVPFLDELRNNPTLQSFRNIIGQYAQYVESWVCSQTPEGYKKLEVQILLSNNSRAFMEYKDTGVTVSGRAVTVNQFSSINERNTEIKRLYVQEHMTQLFIAKIFGLRQPTISRIINS